MSGPSGLRVASVVVSALLVGGLGPADAPGAASVAAVPLSPCVNPDHGAPVVDSVTLSRTRVDVRRRARDVVVSVRVHDTGGPGPAVGVASVQLRLLDAPEFTGGVPVEERPARHVRGDLWQVRLHVGGWPSPVLAVHAVATDRLGQSVENIGAGTPRSPEALLTLTRRRDPSPPVARRLTMTPLRVDARSGRRSVAVSLVATDRDSGISRVSVALAAGRGGTVESALHPVPQRAGVWAGHLSLPPWARPGRWSPTITLVNQAGAARVYDQRSPRGRPQGAARLRLPVVHVRGTLDRTPPVVGTPTVTPRAVDVTAAPARVTVDVRLRDDASGVATAAVTARGPAGAVSLPLRRVAGTPRDGVWRARWTVTTCGAPAGTWTFLVDAADSSGRSSQVEIAAAAAAVEVRNVDRRPPSTAVVGSPPLVVFDEDVTGVSPTSALVEDVRTVRGLVFVTTFPGTWACQDVTGAAVDCVAGPVRSALFRPDGPLPGSGVSVRLNPEHVLDVVDLAGNPAVR